MRALAPLLLLFGSLGCRTHMAPVVDTPEQDPTGLWGAVLADAVDEQGYVDYDYLERHRGALDDYVAWIARAESAPRATTKRLAWHLNAYNALVLWTVLEEGRPKSVLDVDGWLPKRGSGFFLERSFQVGPDRLSLWELEHERVRERTQDYRVHAALNCASRSCPPLRDELYRERGIDVQLRDQMRRWVEDPERGVRIEGDTAVFNPIFGWYAKDFSLWTGGRDLCATAAHHTTGARKRELQQLSARGCPHRFSEYDWSLNESDLDPGVATP